MLHPGFNSDTSKFVYRPPAEYKAARSMSLRPDDDRSRQRSSSHSRARSRSHSRARSPAANYTAPVAVASGTYADTPPYPTHDMAHDSSDASSGDEMANGGYHEQRGPPADSGGVRFTSHAQWGPDAPTGSQGAKYASTRAPQGPIGTYQYATIKDYKFTARPVVQPRREDPVMHAQGPSNNGMPQPFPPPAGQYPIYGGAPPPPPPMANVNAGYGVMGPPPPPPPGGYSQIPAGAVIREVKPGGGRQISPPRGGLRPHSGSLGAGNLRAPSPSGLSQRMNRLSVSGDRPNIQTIVPGGRPPPSPMLEAYQGTYQQMSPMPSPLFMGRRYEDDDIDELELDRHTSRPSRTGRGSFPKRPKKSVTIFNEQAEEDARAIAKELGSAHPNNEVLIEILADLTHDQILELRTEYKRVCKIQGIGINIAKHIKMKLTGNFCKICYVTALGRWESEGYWANFWYQSNSARRELLIESLMGRTNAEIRKIKDTFKDKRYNDDLVRCMDKELKADKFRKAVQLVLEERKQEENDQWPTKERNLDVDDLYYALQKREGGESAILEITVMRSDAHLKDVLKTYERKYGKNFAKECLKKSGNLVGEIVAHILNGIINKPARDAMLLHHALADLAPTSPRDSAHDVNPRSSKTDVKGSSSKKDRYELLVSRLVRMHWDKMHFMRTKLEYKEKYGHYVEEDIENNVKSEDFREFCLAMCDGAG